MPLHCKAFARLNDSSNWNEVDVTFIQTRKTQSLLCGSENTASNVTMSGDKSVQNMLQAPPIHQQSVIQLSTLHFIQYT